MTFDMKVWLWVAAIVVILAVGSGCSQEQEQRQLAPLKGPTYEEMMDCKERVLRRLVSFIPIDEISHYEVIRVEDGFTLCEGEEPL